MKLRNKKTGEIDDVSIVHSANKIKGVVEHEDGVQCLFAYTLKEFNEEWEDYEDPKDYWCVDSDADILHELCDDGSKFDMGCKQIGNYFKTKEEAEQAVEILKALKRLKDKGLRFIHNTVIGEYGYVSYKLNYPVCAPEEKDLDLLFGGKE